MKGIKIISPSIDFYPERIILLSGAGQNVGKTTFACQLIQRFISLDKKVYALKISPHFHDHHPPKTIIGNENFVLSLEDEYDTGKDTSRMKEAGADEVFFLQVQDKYLKEAINYTMSLIPPEVLLVIESGGLRQILKPLLFLFLKNTDQEKMKESANHLESIADKIILFDGNGFDFSPDNIQIINGSIKLNV